MPWKETCAMTERAKLIHEWERRWTLFEGNVNMAALCRDFGVSRKTGYKWVNRYVESERDLRVLEDRSRKPQRHPQALADDVVECILGIRRSVPQLGPKKIRVVMARYHPEWLLP